jgi:hypothetical protein
MARREYGYRLDGNAGVSHMINASFFFGPDNLHPWSASYQRMAELAILLYQRVRTLSNPMNLIS